MTISNLPDKKFKAMDTMMLTDLLRRMDEHNENLPKVIENVKYQKEITELNNTITEKKNC